MEAPSARRSIVVVGATGKTGRYCVKHALATGGRCAAVARTASADKLEALAAQHLDAAVRLSVQAIDLTSAHGLGEIFDVVQPDSVILNVPSFPGSPTNWATSVTEAVLSAAAPRPGIRKFVATAGVGPAGLREGERYRRLARLVLPFFRVLLRARFVDMDAAFKLIREQERPYTIVRAEELNNKPGSGNIHVGPAGHLPSKWLTRDDFGLFCVQATEVGFYDRKEPAICTLTGEETPASRRNQAISA